MKAVATPQSAEESKLARATTKDIEAAALQPGENAAAAILSGHASPSEDALEQSVTLARNEALAFAAPVRTPDKGGGPRNLRNPDLVIGALSQQKIDAPPAFHPLASRLAKRRANAKAVVYAEDNVGVQQMFTLRQGAVRREFIELFGGNEESEEAIKRGLKWLADQQHDDGYWSLHEFYGMPGKKNVGQGKSRSDTAATGFALLPFLGTGQSHKTGDYREQIGKGLKWLVDNQKENGDLYAGGAGNAHMYSHGVAAIALCEAYGMSRDQNLRAPAQKALDFIVSAQHRGSGGWRYNPGQSGDTSVVGWQVMALKSGEMAGLHVPPQTLALAGKWLDSVEGQGNSQGRFGYTSRGGTVAMTAEGLLCRQFMGLGRNDPSMRAGADFLATHLPAAGKDTSYYWYYGTQVMYHMQGDYWTRWNDNMRDMLIARQKTSGAVAGTWDPRDNFEQQGGRLYTTSLRLLMLEVYYRHLPLYRQLDQ